MLHKAPWGKLLVVVSTLATILLLGLAIAAWSFRPGPVGAGFLIAGLPLVVLFGSLVFCVRGYRLDGGHLFVRRLLGETAVDLRELRSAEVDPGAMKGALRTFGNGGLFSFSGLYRGKKLGGFRAFVTDFRKSVVLRLPGRSVVVSPLDPEAFVAELETHHPYLNVTARSND